MAKVSRMPGERTTLLANADLIDDLEFVVDALYPLRDASIEVVDAIQTLSRVLSDLYQAVRV